MTEHDWLTSTNPVAMAEWALRFFPPPVERRAPAWLNDAPAVMRVWRGWAAPEGEWPEGSPVARFLRSQQVEAARLIGRILREAQGRGDVDRSVVYPRGDDVHLFGDWYGLSLPDALRDVLGNPFRPVYPEEVEPYLSERVSDLAFAIYCDDSRFGDLPALADALEEAGCGQAALLGHLRSPGPHCTRCWALALAMGAGPQPHDPPGPVTG
jgi:hypothetical protein